MVADVSFLITTLCARPDLPRKTANEELKRLKLKFPVKVPGASTALPLILYSLPVLQSFSYPAVSATRTHFHLNR